MTSSDDFLVLEKTTSSKLPDRVVDKVKDRLLEAGLRDSLNPNAQPLYFWIEGGLTERDRAEAFRKLDAAGLAEPAGIRSAEELGKLSTIVEGRPDQIVDELPLSSGPRLW